LIKQEALATLCFQMVEFEKEKQQETQELQFAEMKQEVAFLQYENRNLQYVLFFICCHFIGWRSYVALKRM
jgi:hypothetical protein